MLQIILYLYSHMFMLARLFKKINWDAVGIGASVICALHCIALPLFFSSLPLLGIELLENDFIEFFIILISIFIGSFSLVNVYKKNHRSKTILLLFTVGMILVISSTYIELSFIWESFIKLLCAIAIVSAHYLNWKKLHIRENHDRT
jgi:hypothetical protein